MSRPIRNRQRVLDALCQRLWPPAPQPPRSAPRRPLGFSDAEVLRRARRARNGTLFEMLWSGRWEERYGSQSEGDLALCGLLAFWTDGDRECVDALFRQSGLYRPKWDRPDYRAWTLERACSGGRA